ncbi:hypothetical protein BB2000_2318 [Proteus mirabilis BB2000]|nr:hypothetical protein BB2000_2318 [Proteus mirabilis BB2000]
MAVIPSCYVIDFSSLYGISVFLLMLLSSAPLKLA